MRAVVRLARTDPLASAAYLESRRREENERRPRGDREELEETERNWRRTRGIREDLCVCAAARYLREKQVGLSQPAGPLVCARGGRGDQHRAYPPRRPARRTCFMERSASAGLQSADRESADRDDAAKAAKIETGRAPGRQPNRPTSRKTCGECSAREVARRQPTQPTRQLHQPTQPTVADATRTRGRETRPAAARAATEFHASALGLQCAHPSTLTHSLAVAARLAHLALTSMSNTRTSRP